MKIKTEYRNRLPHLAPIGATFFVTFRLGDSLPISIITALKTTFDKRIQQLKEEKGADSQEKIWQEQKLFFKNYDHQLDAQPFGNCH